MKAFAKDNRGVTLIELMIAIIIFAIITIPLLNSFKISTSTAAKSEQMGRVSLTAQNILEIIESSNVSTVLSSEETNNTMLFQADDGVEHYIKDNLNDTYTLVRNNNAVVPNCIWLKGVSSGIGKYNALVEFEPNTDINDKELSVHSPMQFIYSQPSGDDCPDEKFKDSIGIEDDTPNEIEISKRDINLEVNKTGSDVSVVVTYKYKYRYKIEEPEEGTEETPETEDNENQDQTSETENGNEQEKNNGATAEYAILLVEENTEISDSELSYETDDQDKEDEQPGVSFNEAEGSYTVYDKHATVDEDKPFSVYLLYTPMFDIQDEITVVNSQNLEFNLFLVKKNADSEDKPYNCTINQITNDPNKIIIYTNANEGDIIGSDTYDIEYKINNVTTGVNTPDNVKYSLVEKQKQERSYNITIKIYQEDTDSSNFNDEPLFVMNGLSLN